MPETKLAYPHAATPSHATNNDTYLLCTAVPRRTVEYHRHTNHVLLHREPQRLASHSKAHRHKIINELPQRDNTSAAGAKRGCMPVVALYQTDNLTHHRHYKAEER